MNASATAKQPPRRRLWIAGVALLVVVTVAIAAISSALSDGRGGQLEALAQVSEGPLTISVTESGTIQPKDQIIIKSEVEGSASVLFLVEEGTQVKKGDLLVELDASKLQDYQVNQEITVQNSEAAFVNSQENLAVVQNQAKSDVEKAELEFRFAQEDLTKYKEGEYPNQLSELKAKITLATEELERARETLKWSQILFHEKYLSESERKADELAKNKAELDLELAESNLALLQDYTYKRTLDELESNVSQAEMALERVIRKADANKLQAEASLVAKKAEYEQQQSKLKKIEEQIVKAKILAPADGLVVHASSAQSGGRHFFSSEPLAEGASVRERQELIHLPTGSDFVANVSIHESSLQKIRPGLPVRLTVDALPDQSFTGKVVSIAPLPDPQSMYMNPDLKVYDAVINISDASKSLRSGMTCTAEIVVDHYPSATYVPIQSVVQVGGQTVAYVKSGSKLELRPVEIGLDNNAMVRIVSGLTPGEMVSLSPPLDTSAVSSSGDLAGDLDLTGLEGPPPLVGGPAARGAPGAQEGMRSSPQGREAGPGPGGEERGPTQGRNLTAEQLKEIKEKFESMSPEEREASRQQRRQGGDRSTTGQREQ